MFQQTAAILKPRPALGQRGRGGRARKLELELETKSYAWLFLCLIGWAWKCRSIMSVLHWPCPHLLLPSFDPLIQCQWTVPSKGSRLVRRQEVNTGRNQGIRGPPHRLLAPLKCSLPGLAGAPAPARLPLGPLDLLNSVKGPHNTVRATVVRPLQ